MARQQPNHGFTLIELSIVLIIAGLIISGILVGQTLIRSAEIRATVSQKTEFDLAVNTFKLKYNNYLPGDIPPPLAAGFGLFDLSGANSGAPYIIPGFPPVTYATGNGFFEPYSYCCESLVFWRHLSEAGFIKGQYGMKSTNPISSVTGHVTFSTADVSETSDFFPPAKLGGQFFVPMTNSFITPDGVSRTSAKNYFVLNRYTFIGDASNPGGGSERSLPINVYELDKKIDDGLPNSGLARGPQFNWAPTPEDTRCTHGGADQYGADVQYNTDPDNGANSPACYLYIEFK